MYPDVKNGVFDWRRTAIAAAAGAAALVTGLLAAPAQTAAAQASDSCPGAFPVAGLTVGLPAIGLTVEKGTVPDPFTAPVVGVIESGIAPDLDMIIVDTDSPAIQRAGGIWAGMSGSPVYAPDGRLIGAVAYGLSRGPSPIAGVTPAEDMYALLDRPGSTVQPAAKVALPTSLTQRLIASGAVTATEAAGGMIRLPIPLGVSGMNQAHLDEVTDRLQKRMPGMRVYPGGAAAIGSTAPPSEIFPGSNFAAAISYGDLTTVGVGTTTAVCADADGHSVALAFGHPFRFTGTSSMSVHGANAVYVQPDPTLTPFKVANPGGVVGTLDQDRLAGVRGPLGPIPPSVPISSEIASTDPGGSIRSATTRVNLPDFLPDVTFGHLLQNMDRVSDRIGAGTAELRWTIDGTRASGAPFRVGVRNRYASNFDISEASAVQAAEQLLAINENGFEDAKITNISFTGSVNSVFTNYSIDSILVRKASGQFVPAPTDEPLEVVAGSRLNLRVVLRPYKNIGPLRNVDLSVVVPPDTAGGAGSVDIVGGSSDSFPEELTSFDQLLAQLRGTVPNDSVNVALTVERETSTGVVTHKRSARALVDKVVVGVESFPLVVVPPRQSRAGVVDGDVWKLRPSLSSGSATTTFTFGRNTDRQLMGDWDGNGTLTPAVFRDGTWFVRMNWTTTTTALVSFTFGQAGDLPVAGDWDGNGRDTIGVFRDGRWLLRNSLSSGPAHLEFTYGSAGWRPVTGDWDGDGRDSVGLFRTGSWALRNSNSAGAATYQFTYGTAGDLPVVGEWDLDGRDEIGVYRKGQWLLRNRLASGSTSQSFTFGGATSHPVVWG